MTMMYSMDPTALAASLSLFARVSQVIVGMVALAFTLRVSLMAIGLASAWEYGELLKGICTFFVMLMLFPKLVTIMFSLISQLAEKISFIQSTEQQERINDFFNKVFDSSGFIWFLGKVGHFAVDAIAVSFYTLSIGLLLAIAPIVLFLNLVLGFSHGTRYFFGLLISLSLWPVLWNLLGKLGTELATHLSDAPIRIVFYWLVVQLLQLLSPMFAIALFKNLSSTEVGPQLMGLMKKPWN